MSRLSPAAALAVTALLTAAPQPLNAQTPAPAAHSPMSGVLAIDGKQVPLPEGAWTVAGDRTDGEGIHHRVLVQVQDGTVTGAVMIHATGKGVPAAWGLAPGCRRVDLPFAQIRYASDHDGSCAYVTTVAAGHEGPMDPAWVSALGTIGERRWRLPEHWAATVIRVSDRLGAVQVRYAFPLTDDALLVESLPGWTVGAWNAVEQGLLNRLDPQQSLPLPGGINAPNRDADAGGLTVPQAVWKTLTFRAVVTTLDFTSNAIAIGNLTTAALLSAWNTLTGPWVYLAHELAWDYFGATSTPDRDLPGLGEEAGILTGPT